MATRCLVERCAPRHRDRNISGIWEDKLADLNRDLANGKFSQEMGRDLVGQGLDQFGRMLAHEVFRFLGQGGVIHRPADRVVQVPQIARRPCRYIKNELLRFRPLGLGNAYVCEQFQLLDVNFVLRPCSHLASYHLSASERNRVIVHDASSF